MPERTHNLPTDYDRLDGHITGGTSPGAVGRPMNTAGIAYQLVHNRHADGRGNAIALVLVVFLAALDTMEHPEH